VEARAIWKLCDSPNLDVSFTKDTLEIPIQSLTHSDRRIVGRYLTFTPTVLRTTVELLTIDFFREFSVYKLKEISIRYNTASRLVLKVQPVSFVES